MKQNTRVRLGRLVAVIGCAVAAAIMLCMKPRPALAYSTYEIPCQYSGDVSTTARNFPTGMYGERNYYSMTFDYELEYGKPDGQNWNDTYYGFTSPLTIQFVAPSQTATYNGYLYGSLIMTFGGRNIGKGGLYKNIETFWPRGLARYGYYIQYDSNNTLNTLSLNDLQIVPTSYGWYGRTSSESTDSWHTGSSVTDYQNGSRVYAIGMLWRTDEQISTDAGSTTSSSGTTHYGNRYWFSLMEKPVTVGYVEDSDMINAIDSIDDNIQDYIDDQTNDFLVGLQTLGSSITSKLTHQEQQYSSDMDYQNMVITDTVGQQTQSLKSTTGSGTILSNLTDGGTSDFDERIGLLGQLNTVTDTYMSALQSSPDGTVHFPGITVLGRTIVGEADVNVWSNGLSEWREPCRMIVTFGFIACWVNGMKRVLDYQILGQPYDGTDEP